MYKLFLTFRYLTRRKIVAFPILVVWLCVMMLIIVSSIMGGFVERVRQTNHDLFGDIVISNGGSSLGWSHYEELQALLKAQFPDIEASTPVVEAYALVYVKDYAENRPAKLIGIDPVERSKVSKYRESLFRQYQAPMQAAEDLDPRLPATREELIAYASKNLAAAEADYNNAADAADKLGQAPPVPHPDFWWLLGLLPIAALATWLVRPRRRRSASSFIAAGLIVLSGLAVITLGIVFPIIFPHQLELADDRASRAKQDYFRAARTAQFAAELPPGRYAGRDDLLHQFLPPEPSFKVPPEAANDVPPDTTPAPDGIVIGSRMGFFKRDQRGNFVRLPTQDYYQVIVTVFPVSQKSGAIDVRNNSNSHTFTDIDDSYSGVYDVDLQNCYADFHRVQLMAGMAPDPDIVKDHPEANFAPMCNEVLIKLKAPTTPEKTREIRAQMSKVVSDFEDAHPGISRFPLVVRTWDEEQARYLNAVQNEKTMMTFILGLMSCVVLVVIFLIFYQIVRDKTRDIGIIKAVGGSEEGVAGIFLIYGLFVGIVGGALGALSGVAFVTHTNQIHEWIYHTTGVVIWDRSVYLFDTIPDQVNPHEVAIYFTVALAAGVLGALIPAIVAAAEDPVKAVRYE